MADRPPTLCTSCTFMRHVHGRRGQLYLLCRNETIPAKYPRQPVLTCPGYESRTTAEGHGGHFADRTGVPHTGSPDRARTSTASGAGSRGRDRVTVARGVAGLFETPIVGAPLAGGPSTPALAAAVSEAGGLGFIAAGYKTAAAVQTELDEVKTLTSKRIGINLFYPIREQVDEPAIEAYADRMRREGERYGVVPGDPMWTDDEWMAKLELAAQNHVDVVSFTFGCPSREIVAWLQSAGCRVWSTVTSIAEAQHATAATVDGLVVQGAEAGGHQGSFHDHDDPPLPLIALLDSIRGATRLPLIAAGGIATGSDVARALASGAAAAQVGSALLLATEAGTSAPHRDALRAGGETRLTRAFTGRRARGIVNRFMLEHDAFAPRAYPEIHYLTAPIRAAARTLGDADGINLWAGTAYRRARVASASELVERWTHDLRARGTDQPV
jgi:nitronate monooxygenase